jgi:hypothetical protein
MVSLAAKTVMVLKATTLGLVSDINIANIDSWVVTIQ